METTDIFKVNGSATPCVDATMSIMEIT
jgi:hypothetical protein